MRWADIFEFMIARDPKYAASVQPVAREDIEACQRHLGIVLPPFYVDFLASVGGGSGRYHPFGRTQDHDFYALVELMPPKGYPVADYFKVTLQVEEEEEIEEVFLDLTRAADEHTPLVTIDVAGPFQRSQVRDLGMSLGEALAERAFAEFEVDGKQRRAAVVVGADTEGEAALVRAKLIERIETDVKLEPALPPLPRFACFVDEHRAASVRSFGEPETMLELVLGGPDSSIRPLADQLTSNLPAATFVAWRTPNPRA